MEFSNWVEQEFFGNTLFVWILGACAIAAAWIILLLLRGVFRKRLGDLADKQSGVALRIAFEIARKTRSWFLMLIAVFFGSRFWTLDAAVDGPLTRVVIIALLIQVGVWLTTALTRFIAARREEELEDNRGAVAAMDILSFVSRLAVWTFVLLLILDNLGVNITALVAGLGVGGIAVALAAQNILGDLFASLSIILDKPFIVGDFLAVDSYLGSVEKIGIKTTRVRSLSGEQLVFSNNDLLSSRVRNYGRLFERRVVFSVGVTYQTSAAQLKEIPAMLRAAVEANDDVRFDRAHFQKYGDFALIFEVVYFVLSPDYNRYMDIQQAVNLTVFEDFEKAGVEFAYPTQTVYLQNSTGASEAV